MIRRFDAGDRVRVDIPDTFDPDHEVFHGKHGVVSGTIEDAADEETGDERDSVLYRVQFDNGVEMDL